MSNVDTGNITTWGIKLRDFASFERFVRANEIIILLAICYFLSQTMIGMDALGETVRQIQANQEAHSDLEAHNGASLALGNLSLQIMINDLRSERRDLRDVLATDLEMSEAQRIRHNNRLADIETEIENLREEMRDINLNTGS